MEIAQAEINRLEDEVEKANIAIDNINKEITDGDVNNIKTEYTTEQIANMNQQNEDIANNLVVSGWGTNHIQLDFNLLKEIKLGYNLNDKNEIVSNGSANIIIDYYAGSALIYSKNEIWSGYLNSMDELVKDANGNMVPKKYCGGHELDARYPNELSAQIYGTAVNNGPFIKTDSITKIIVTVIDNDGNQTILEANR